MSDNSCNKHLNFVKIALMMKKNLKNVYCRDLSLNLNLGFFEEF